MGPIFEVVCVIIFMAIILLLLWDLRGRVKGLEERELNRISDDED